MSSPVTLNVDDDGVARVHLDDAEHRNALSKATSDALAHVIDDALARDAGAIVLTAAPPGRDRELVRVTKRTLLESAALTDADAAADAGLPVQQWSMDRPGFADGIRALQARIARARDERGEP
ncbi:MAG TPA: hypothetical protein VIB48_08650 [Acidimicrobiia bacterium]